MPVDGKPLDLLKENLKGKKLPGEQYAAAKVLYDVVNTHMKYSKEGKGWGQGDSVWACDSKFGNCTDFHSLFISMARQQDPRSSRWAFRFHPSVATASSAATTAGPGSCRTARVGSLSTSPRRTASPRCATTTSAT